MRNFRLFFFFLVFFNRWMLVNWVVLISVGLIIMGFLFCSFLNIWVFSVYCIFGCIVMFRDLERFGCCWNCFCILMRFVFFGWNLIVRGRIFCLIEFNKKFCVFFYVFCVLFVVVIIWICILGRCCICIVSVLVEMLNFDLRKVLNGIRSLYWLVFEWIFFLIINSCDFLVKIYVVCSNFLVIWWFFFFYFRE